MAEMLPVRDGDRRIGRLCSMTLLLLGHGHALYVHILSTIGRLS